MMRVPTVTTLAKVVETKQPRQKAKPAAMKYLAKTDLCTGCIFKPHCHYTSRIYNDDKTFPSGKRRLVGFIQCEELIGCSKSRRYAGIFIFGMSWKLELGSNEYYGKKALPCASV